MAELLTDKEEKELKELIDNFIKLTNMDLVILTDRVVYEDDRENDYYALDFYDYNDFGIDYDLYDGVILFRNTYESDRYYNIYTTGNAMFYFDYNRCESILDKIYDDFVNNRYYNGMETFISELINYYNDGIVDDYNDAYIDDNGNIVYHRTFNPPFIFAGIISLIASIVIVFIMINKNKMVYKAHEAKEYLDENSIIYNKHTCKLIKTYTTSHYNPPSSSSSGGSGFHSGSSGISHGGGGGRHG